MRVCACDCHIYRSMQDSESAEIRKSRRGYYVVLSTEMVVKGIVASLNNVNVVTEYVMFVTVETGGM
jgi:hypothetical protein